MDLISKLTDKQSESTTPKAGRLGSAMAFAHYLGLPGRVTEAAKPTPSKVKAVAEKLTPKPIASLAPAPQVPVTAKVTPTAPAPAASDSSRIKRQAITDERIRCAEIVAAGIKAGQTNQACALAFDSNLTAAEAIAALKAAALDSAAQGQDSRRIRMGLIPAELTAQPSRAQPTAKELAARIIAAGERARAE
jgi:hypothetical protein